MASEVQLWSICSTMISDSESIDSVIICVRYSACSSVNCCKRCGNKAHSSFDEGALVGNAINCLISISLIAKHSYLHRRTKDFPAIGTFIPAINKLFFNFLTPFSSQIYLSAPCETAHGLLTSYLAHSTDRT